MITKFDGSRIKKSVDFWQTIGIVPWFETGHIRSFLANFKSGLDNNLVAAGFPVFFSFYIFPPFLDRYKSSLVKLLDMSFVLERFTRSNVDVFEVLIVFG